MHSKSGDTVPASNPLVGTKLGASEGGEEMDGAVVGGMDATGVGRVVVVEAAEATADGVMVGIGVEVGVLDAVSVGEVEGDSVGLSEAAMDGA